MVLVGDSACLVRHYDGMGVTKAASDAVAFADAVGGVTSIESCVRAYDAERHMGKY